MQTNTYGNFILFEWISSGNFVANWSINIDPLSSVMLVVVTFVSALVHIYSIGYMSHDPHKPRFMSYLSLFTFSMLVLVVSDNFLQLFFGWEGVGLCSYLLIGFWYKKESANNAAIKAFIVNRVGDFGLAIGIFLIFFYFGTINFQEVFELAPQFIEKKLVFFGFETTLITLICLFLFIGAMGKSAQFLLHTWLPDAMEGPTPVSALIHAATMVTAGVFLVVRCSPLFEYSQTALNLVTIVGMITAIFAASVALVQNDIKKIVQLAISEDIGDGDLTSTLLENKMIVAEIVCRENAVICGIDFANLCFLSIDPKIQITWNVEDGSNVIPDQIICRIYGFAKTIVTAERVALTFLQILSATSTKTAELVGLISGTKAKLLDTRKTIPGLRKAQKYAVKCGGGVNHRMGLYDCIMLKENHILTIGSLEDSIKKALINFLK